MPGIIYTHDFPQRTFVADDIVVTVTCQYCLKELKIRNGAGLRPGPDEIINAVQLMGWDAQKIKCNTCLGIPHIDEYRKTS